MSKKIKIEIPLVYLTRLWLVIVGIVLSLSPIIYVELKNIIPDSYTQAICEDASATPYGFTFFLCLLFLTILSIAITAIGENSS